MTGEERIAAPSSLAGINSHLATDFELLGRTGGWDPATQQGIPIAMHSMQTKSMLRGYCCDHTLELNTFLCLGFTTFCCYCSLMPNTVARLDVCMLCALMRITTPHLIGKLIATLFQTNLGTSLASCTTYK